MLPRPSSKTFSIVDYLFALLVFAASLVLYLRTLIPTLLLGDGGEFQVLGYTLGVGHPTGYPVYLLLVKLVTFLPVGDIAYRANLSSALFGSLALALVYLSGRLLGGRQVAALVGPAALALTPMFWWHAVMAEVYTPAAAFIALVLLLVLLWRKTGRPAFLFWAGLAGGLSPGVHGMIPLLAPAVGVFLLLGSFKVPGWKVAWLSAFGGALFGVLLWVGAFWALDLHNPPSNNLLVSARYNLDVWNIAPQDFDSSFWVRFKYVSSGRMFHELMLRDTKKELLLQGRRYWLGLLEMFSPVFLGLSAGGLLGLFIYDHSAVKRNPFSPSQWREGLFLLLAWLGLVAFVLTYQIYDIWVFYIPTFVPLAILASLGAAFLADLGFRLLGRLPRWPGWALPLLSGVLGLSLLALVVRPYLPALKKSWDAHKITFLDKEEYRYYPYPTNDPSYPHRYASQIAFAVEDNAIVFTTWDMVYPILYVVHVEQGRTGVQALETYRTLSDINPSDMTIAYIRSSLPQRPIYLTRLYDNLRSRFNFKKVPGVDLYQVTGVK